MPNSALVATRRRALATLVPPPRLVLSAWIETHLRLPAGVSALPGPVTLWPYQVEIADAIGDPTIERVTLVKPVRVGFSTLLTGAVGSFVANDPSPMLVLLPTEADTRDYVVSDIEPIFEATPALRGLMNPEQDETGRNTLTSRRFPGGSLKVLPAKAPRNLRRHNVRVLLVDEADAMEVTSEGDPITLGERRTLSFANRKIVIGSTPLSEETSHVLRSYANSDQRIFEVPCPDCGAFHEILWAHIEWETGQPETAAYRCPSCSELIQERHKPAMVAAGRWRATRPEITGHAGFRLNALVSLLANASWAKLAAEFVTAKDHPDKLQTFVNTILAQGWRETADTMDETALHARAEDFSLDAIPPEVLAITVGVDVQNDRLESTIVGWSRTEMLILAHSIVWGSPHEGETWLELDELLRTRWRHPFGGSLRVDAAVIDSGDGNVTDVVYGFAFPRAARRVMAGKGLAGSHPAIVPSKTKVRGGRLWLIGVDGLKAELISRLTRGTTIRFSASLGPDFFEQLTAERRVVRYSRGQPVARFERVPGRRAEALDCVVYAMAARRALSLSLYTREGELNGAKALPELPRTIPSKWLQDAF